MTKPIVLCSLPRQTLAANFSAAMRTYNLPCRFFEILVRLGCVPIAVPVDLEQGGLTRLLAVADGLLLTSGQDIAPERYGEVCKVNYTAEAQGVGTPFNRPLILKPDSQRDELELLLYHHARSAKLPILGICRGMQVINVGEGGTLYQELPPSHIMHQLGEDGWVHHHPIKVVQKSLLAQLTQGTAVVMSSVHHQGIKSLAPSLIATAHASDGVIEAVELGKRDHFVLGIQGHAEQSIQNFPFLSGIWSEFANAMHRRKQND
nr:gamma-glutamyl-gamma-aminobutyrate hydrolase family protein [uncultured Pseudomonas sp.]